MPTTPQADRSRGGDRYEISCVRSAIARCSGPPGYPKSGRKQESRRRWAPGAESRQSGRENPRVPAGRGGGTRDPAREGRFGSDPTERSPEEPRKAAWQPEGSGGVRRTPSPRGAAASWAATNGRVPPGGRCSRRRHHKRQPSDRHAKGWPPRRQKSVARERLARGGAHSSSGAAGGGGGSSVTQSAVPPRGPRSQISPRELFSIAALTRTCR